LGRRGLDRRVRPAPHDKEQTMPTSNDRILHEVRYLMKHRTDHLSADAVLENIARALDGEIFDPEVRRADVLRRRVNSHDPQHMHQDLAAALDVALGEDRKSTRLNSSHVSISYAVFCLKKKKYTALVSHVV